MSVVLAGDHRDVAPLHAPAPCAVPSWRHNPPARLSRAPGHELAVPLWPLPAVSDDLPVVQSPRAPPIHRALPAARSVSFGQKVPRLRIAPALPTPEVACSSPLCVWKHPHGARVPSKLIVPSLSTPARCREQEYAAPKRSLSSGRKVRAICGKRIVVGVQVACYASERIPTHTSRTQSSAKRPTPVA